MREVEEGEGEREIDGWYEVNDVKEKDNSVYLSFKNLAGGGRGERFLGAHFLSFLGGGKEETSSTIIGKCSLSGGKGERGGFCTISDAYG